VVDKSVTLHLITNPKRIALRSNRGLCGEIPASQSLSGVSAPLLSHRQIMWLQLSISAEENDMIYLLTAIG